MKLLPKILSLSLLIVALASAAWWGWSHVLCKPTTIVLVNLREATEADILANNDHPQIRLKSVPMSELRDFKDIDAVFCNSYGLTLDEEQQAAMEEAVKRGMVVYSHFSGSTTSKAEDAIYRNLTPEQIDTLQSYFQNQNRENYRNGLRYLRHLATPHAYGDQHYEKPQEMPKVLFYHREYGKYFKNPRELEEYLKEKGLFHEGAPKLALIGGITFPMEGNRPHLDTLITQFTEKGYNVYPLTAVGPMRGRMLKMLHPDAIINIPMGVLGNDSLVQSLHAQNIPVFAPFPANMTREEWQDKNRALAQGTKTSRIVLSEIDGGIAPYCIAQHYLMEDGSHRWKADVAQCQRFVNYVDHYLGLRTKDNANKKVAICYFKQPGKDALLASGMEVIPSLYNFLNKLASAGYNVKDLPSTLAAFEQEIHQKGWVPDFNKPEEVQSFIDSASPLWIEKSTYENWAQQVLTPSAYQAVEQRYGAAPGNFLAKDGKVAMACLQYGNVLIFPQPRAAVGEDDYKMVHGVDVPPPHTYLAPYLYMQEGFGADILIHFGTHGSQEFTPGRDAAMRPDDWSFALVGDRPHFYFYTTGNVGEGVIAKRRTHAALVSHLTAPYVESGMRQKYADLLDQIHKAIETEGKDIQLVLSIKKQITAQGLNRELGLDDKLEVPYTQEELERLDAHLEEICNEHMQGAFYVMGEPYSASDNLTTTLAIAAEPLAFSMAKADSEAGKITPKDARSYEYVAHHYLAKAKQQITVSLQAGKAVNSAVEEALTYSKLLAVSPQQELDAMLHAMNGSALAPAPGGDPVLQPNVLPTGRNMYSINPESTPDKMAWERGKILAENTLASHLKQHGSYPKKVAYTFWAGEFISSGGATVAQALWMLGVEPVRDSQGRISELRVVPTSELKRPRVNVVVQVSGQLRDIAESRLRLITDAIRMVSELDEPDNGVREGTLEQEKLLTQKGLSAKQARELSVMRIFGPANGGYSTGMLNRVERSQEWTDTQELTADYLNNMGAMYGDEEHWGQFTDGLFESALSETEVIIQPRQSNTWGPLSLDHVYEFTGGLSMTVKQVTGKEPDAFMADYRNVHHTRMQDLKEAMAVEVRTTLLNPVFVKERMKGAESTAEAFGELFRNVFGWSVTRQSVLDEELYQDMFDMYIADAQNLGIQEYLQKVDPAALASMTTSLQECARKGYWKATESQLKKLADTQATVSPAEVTSVADNGKQMVLRDGHAQEGMKLPTDLLAGIAAIVLIFVGVILFIRNKKK